MSRPIAAVLLLLLAAPALAQDGSEPPVSDYRGAVYTACSLVFAAILIYLILAHRSAARAASDLAHLERRVAALDERG